MSTFRLHRHDVSLLPDSSRVIIRPFIPGSTHQITTTIGRALLLSEEEVADRLQSVKLEFDSRHVELESLLLAHFGKVQQHIFTQRPLSQDRKLLIGALFSGEYAVESAALFNPSIVPHPDQRGIAEGGLRFIMSLRATGEGHISSIEFRSGEITPEGRVVLEPTSRFLTAPQILPNPNYSRNRFLTKLHEMGFDAGYAVAVMGPLAESFTLSDLKQSMDTVRRESQPNTHELESALESIQWLADSNYELHFSDTLAVSERIIFPVSPNETNGIEDARFVRFINDDGSIMYYATYTAYNGRDILPMLLETEDFLHFHVLTLNGDAVQNKGMALFPRRVNGRYVMLSRQDNENTYIMFSDSPYHWSRPELILRPCEMWESVKIGNCGSPIETEAGWLVITHGVGPLRKYCIGAVLLDLEDPTKVIGRLARPLLCPEGPDREGYVPNVVYSCGSLLHGDQLFVPFAISDRATFIGSASVNLLLSEMLSSQT